ncbi:putative nuclease HARBI1 [Alosa alosa]|uniref:putative nuclease HARBI1 n=1 Tax=Alosa sapidissima TaxID=34773 RepID=UPI001C09D13E|nr:putative nuclease HARBI1 [Alosa sapidissima]XP_048083501.1 putative nuclease HARBI1 [Alosa alosa]
MNVPFVKEVIVDEGANIVNRAFRRGRILIDRLDPLAHPDDYLYDQYRFSREGIIYLEQLLGRHLASPTERSAALTVVQTLCIGLRFFATGTYLYAVGDAENISKASVSRAIRKVYLALKRYVNVFIRFPGHAKVDVIKEGFLSIAGIPDVLGVVDCTQIPIKSPPGPHEGDYINTRAFYSINVQMICDSTCVITNIEAKWPGAVLDDRIFKESSLCDKFDQGQYDGILLGDTGYTCRTFFMTPYSDPSPGPQARFNAALAQTRSKIETTIGQLRGRFQCLKGLRVVPDRACDITVACAVLHNIATIRKESAPPVCLQPNDDVETLYLDEPEGLAMRDKIAAQNFS